MNRLRRTLDRIRGRSISDGHDPAASSREVAQPDVDRSVERTRAPGAKSRADHRRAAGQRLLHIDLPEWQVAIIDREIQRLGVSRVGWVRTLIANRLREEPRFTREAELALFDVVRALRAIGQDLATLRRRFEADAGADAAAVLEQIERQEVLLGKLRSALRAAFKGNLDYWRTPE